MSGFTCYRNRFDAATVTSSWAVAPGYPLANLKTRQGSEFARWNTTTSFYLQLNFGAPVRPRFIGMFATNASAMTPTMLLVTSSTSAGGSYSTVTHSGTPADDGSPNLPKDIKVLIPRSAIARRYWRLYPGFPVDAGVGHRQIGRIWVSTETDMVEFDDGFDFNFSRRIVDSGKTNVVADGSVIEGAGDRMRVLDCTVSGIEVDDAFGFSRTAASADMVASLDDFQMTAGCTGEVVVSPRSHPLWMHRLGMRGSIPDGVDGPAHQGADNYEARWRVVEEA